MRGIRDIRGPANFLADYPLRAPRRRRRRCRTELAVSVGFDICFEVRGKATYVKILW